MEVLLVKIPCKWFPDLTTDLNACTKKKKRKKKVAIYIAAYVYPQKISHTRHRIFSTNGQSKFIGNEKNALPHRPFSFSYNPILLLTLLCVYLF